LRPGDVVADRFEVVRRSGQGGMGVVYEARDRALGRTVALKVLDRTRANPERFLREAVALADLRHPAIVEYVAHGATPLSRGSPPTGGSSNEADPCPRGRPDPRRPGGARR